MNITTMLSPNPYELLVGLPLSLLVALLGHRRGALSRGGAAGAIIIGSLTFGWGGWAWGLLLIAFFASSSALSFYRSRDKRRLAEKFAKGHRRDIGQVMANGGLVAILAVFSRLFPHPLWFFAGAGALAAVNADTWATELGVLSAQAPRLITTGQPVEVGSSGGVTMHGIAASLAGGAVIGCLGGLSARVLGRGWAYAGSLLASATLGGLGGSLIDSLLGATLQAIYWCDTCEKETERRIHRCGTRTRNLRGWRWLGNDWVNFTASAIGGCLSVAIGGFLL